MKNIHVAYYELLVVKFYSEFHAVFHKTFENFPLVHNIHVVKIALKLQSSNIMLTTLSYPSDIFKEHILN